MKSRNPNKLAPVVATTILAGERGRDHPCTAGGRNIRVCASELRSGDRNMRNTFVITCLIPQCAMVADPQDILRTETFLGYTYVRFNQQIYLPGGSVAPTPGETVTAQLTASQTAFAMTVGGELDIKLNKHLSLRHTGLDYFLTRLKNLRTLGDNNQHNLRYTAGLNFTFGAQ